MHKSKQEPRHTLYTALVTGIDFSFRTIATFFPPALHIHASVAAASRELLATWSWFGIQSLWRCTEEGWEAGQPLMRQTRWETLGRWEFSGEKQCWLFCGPAMNYVSWLHNFRPQPTQLSPLQRIDRCNLLSLMAILWKVTWEVHLIILLWVFMIIFNLTSQNFKSSS